MIEILRNGGNISVNGHAAYAEIGQDIVCAGISTLVQTLICSVEQLTDAKISYDISPGTADIHIGHLSEQARILINAFSIGCELIANAYPHNVRYVQA